MSNHKTWVFVFGLFILPMLYPGAIILSRAGLLGGDLPLYHLPHQEFIREHLVQGVIPFWNPYVFGGSPEFDNPEMTPMYWTNAPLLLAFGADAMLRLKFLLHLGLLGAGAFLLFQRLRVGAWLALAGAVTLQLSGFATTKITLPNVGDSAAWLPLVLFLTLWLRDRITTGRVLLCVLLFGMMAQLFFPQITLSITLLAAVLSGCYYIKGRAAFAGRGKWLDRVVLPLCEGIVLLCLLRYPTRHIPFPEPGWRNAFGGFGLTGIVALMGTGVFWVAWLYVQRARVTVHWRRLVFWGMVFVAVWVFAAMFAAPQLAMTAEMIPQSNQSSLDYVDEDFFTGAQAYGSTREFIQQSVLAKSKESVNNMALGPVPWGLAVLGVLLGFHRRHRTFLFFAVLAGSVFLVYMAAPFTFDIFRHLPFFKSFAGLSRYLAFLNFALVALAVLAAGMLVHKLPFQWRKLASTLFFISFLLNGMLLLRHDVLYWEKLGEGQSGSYASDVADWIQPKLTPGGRLLVDGRTDVDYYQVLLFGVYHRIEAVHGLEPMRTVYYDRWLRSHNKEFEVDHSDYRAAKFEPIPSSWLRAFGVTEYLFRPDLVPPKHQAKSIVQVGEHAGWRLYTDPSPWPFAWPYIENETLPARPTLPAEWAVERELRGPNSVWYGVRNSDTEVRGVAVSMPWYPGWQASVNGESVPVGRAYGFLQSISVLPGNNDVLLVYRPLSFTLGWVVFLWALCSWSTLVVHWMFVGEKRHTWRAFWWWGFPGVVFALWRFSFVSGAPELFFVRIIEILGAAGIGVAVAFLWRGRSSRSRLSYKVDV